MAVAPLSIASLLPLLFLLLVSCLVRQASGQASFHPGASPLVVKTPYLNYWLNTQDRGDDDGGSTASWPTTWNDLTIGWAGMARVDGVLYQWMGMAWNQTVRVETSYTPTRTTVVHHAGPVEIRATYLSPIEPQSLVLQSIPFGYLSVTVRSLDEFTHTVQLYSDVSGEPVSSGSGNAIQWEFLETNDTVIHKFYRPRSAVAALVFPEALDSAEDGEFYYAMPKVQGISWMAASDTEARALFNTSGSLDNSIDMQFRAIDKDWPVFAIAVDLGEVFSVDVPVVWTLGLVRDPVARYIAVEAVQERTPFYKTVYGNVTEMVRNLASNYAATLANASAFDNLVSSAASQISPQYAELVALATRQVFAAVDITVPRYIGDRGDSDNVLAFMKDIGSGGRINAVETLYEAFPAFLFLNASFCRPLLESIMYYQVNHARNTTWAVPDLGVAYPYALGPGSDSESRAVEMTASMILLNHAYAIYTGDGTLLGRYYNLLKRWADYLQASTLNPSEFLINDARFAANDVNVALKGIIALKSMAEIGRITKRMEDATQYDAVAAEYATQWARMGLLDNEHLGAVYNQEGSWGLISNLYMDRLLGTNVVDKRIYTLQDDFYKNLSSNASSFGFAISSLHPLTARLPTLLLTAASSISNETRDIFINMAHAVAGINVAYAPLYAKYSPRSGQDDNQLSGRASPALGAVFAPLTLGLSPVPVIVPANTETIDLPPAGEGSDSTSGNSGSASASGSKKLSKGGIAGVVIGTLIGLSALLALSVWGTRRRRTAKKGIGFGKGVTMGTRGLGALGPVGTRRRSMSVGTGKAKSVSSVVLDYGDARQIVSPVPSRPITMNYEIEFFQPEVNVPFREAAAEASLPAARQPRFSVLSTLESDLTSYNHLPDGAMPAMQHEYGGAGAVAIAGVGAGAGVGAVGGAGARGGGEMNTTTTTAAVAVAAARAHSRSSVVEWRKGLTRGEGPKEPEY